MFIDKSFGVVGEGKEAKIARRKLARDKKNFVVLTLRKLMSARTGNGRQLGSKKAARNLYNIMKANAK